MISARLIAGASFAGIALIAMPAQGKPPMPTAERQLEYAIIGAINISSEAWDEGDFKAACVGYGNASAMLNSYASNHGRLFRDIGYKPTEKLIVDTYARWAAACNVAPLQRENG